MPLTPLKLQPGVNNVASPQLNIGGWEECNAGIRFFEGLAQKDGGYEILTQTLPGAGPPLWLYAWATLAGINYLAIACQNRINLYGGGAGIVQDITPNTLPPATIPIALSVTAGSSLVTIQDIVSQPAVGDVLTFEQPISLGGKIILGPNGGFVTLPTYIVTNIVDSTHYQIQASVNAVVTANNGGQGRTFTSAIGSGVIFVNLPYHNLETGQTVPILLPEADVGGISINPGNYPITVLSQSSYTIDFSPQVATSNQTVAENGGNLGLFFFGGGTAPNNILASGYTLGNWGQDLVACPTGGPIFIWNPTTDGGMSLLSNNAPAAVTAIFITAAVQQIFAIGSTDPVTGMFDPMLVRWCDIGDFTDWTASTTNQAGSFRLSLGSRITTGLSFSLNTFIWSDTSLYSAQYLGFPLVWGFQPVDSGSGTNALHDATVLREVVYWKGDNQFFSFSGGGVQMIPCPVWDQIFRNIKPHEKNTFTGANSWFNELRFFFTNDAGGISFARWQLDAGPQGWTYGDLDRTAWIDASPFGAPIACDAEGSIYQHETGTDADGKPLKASIKTGIIEISDGDEMTFVREFYPDIMFSRVGSPPGPGTVALTLFLYRKSAQDPPVIKGPYYMNAQTRMVRPRVRARGIQWQLESGDLGSWWRVGLPKYRGHPDGRN